MPIPFRLYNTLVRDVQEFTPIEPGKISLYVCGMTVYDEAHLGHARAMVVFDAFVRAQTARGWDVTFTRNFTDVDDKIISRAAENGEEPMALAQRFIDHFHRDASALGLSEPTHEPRVSTSMPAIIALIGRLVERDHAYASEGSVWFSVTSCETYGKLSGQKVEHLNANADAQSGTRSGLALGRGDQLGERTRIPVGLVRV